MTARGNPTHVALLRGINVGGKNMLPMKTLMTLAADAGCQDVSSYIQSGNLLFRAAPRTVARLPKALSKAIAAQFGFEVPVIVRSADELREITLNNPFLEKNASAAGLHVAFLADPPTAAQVAGLDPDRSPPDRFEVRGREIYLLCPNGAGQTKLTNAYFDSKLRTTSTARNWKTVSQLLELMGGG